MLNFASISYAVALVLGCVLGYSFSFYAWNLAEFSNYIIFIMMFLSGVSLGRLEPELNTLSQSGTLKKLLTNFGLVFLTTQVILPIVFFHASRFLIADFDLNIGILICNLMPVAIVIPQLLVIHRQPSRYAFHLLFLSTLISPLSMFFCLSLISEVKLLSEVKSLFSVFLLIATVAPSIGFFIGRLVVVKEMPNEKWQRVNIVQSVLLTLLVFVIFGSVFRHFSFRQIEYWQWFYLVAFAFLQDFGTYFIFRYIGVVFFEQGTSQILAYSFGMRNVALASGPLLLWNPRSALPMVLVFLIHSIFLIWLNFRLKKDIVIKDFYSYS